MAETVRLETAEKYRAKADTLKRLAEALTYEVWFEEDCEVIGLSGSGRCIEPSIGIRWEHGFMDRVCEEHARRAEVRGVIVVRPKTVDGTVS